MHCCLLRWWRSGWGRDPSGARGSAGAGSAERLGAGRSDGCRAAACQRGARRARRGRRLGPAGPGRAQAGGIPLCAAASTVPTVQPSPASSLRSGKVELGRVPAPPGLRDGGGDSGDLPRGLGRREDESRRRESFEDKKHPCVIPRQPRTAPRAPPGTAGAAGAGEVPLLLVMLVHPTGPDGCWGRWYQSHQCRHPGDPARTPALLLPPSGSSHGGGAVATNSSARARSQPAWCGHRSANATCTVTVTSW